MENIYNIIYDLEISLLNNKETKSADEISTIFADDFTEFGNSNEIYYKPDKIDKYISNDDNNKEYEISNYGLKILSDNIVLSTFKATNKISTTIQSSIWRKSDIGEWQIFFHQVTSISQ